MRLFEFFVLDEMPHIEMKDEDKVIDLRIEKYPISQEEKKKLFLAYKGEGFVGKLSKSPRFFAFFSSSKGLELATPEQISSLPHLPDSWEEIMITS